MLSKTTFGIAMFGIATLGRNNIWSKRCLVELGNLGNPCHRPNLTKPNLTRVTTMFGYYLPNAFSGLPGPGH
jgi:hypothetical protein